MINIKNEVLRLKEEFVYQFGKSKIVHPDSIFLIGSCAGKEDDYLDWYQDFDIHLLFNKPNFSTEELTEIRNGFIAIKEKFNIENVLTDWKIKDRHWKLVPNNNYDLNLSVHGTLTNCFDLYRRTKVNTILGWNMYQLCEVLYGKPPSSYSSINKPTILDLFHGVGGVSWMIENFYRALWFYFSEPEEQQFYPYIQGYCWNVPSSIMLQYYLMKKGEPGTRKDALSFVLNQKEFPNSLKEKLENIIKNKRKSDINEQIHKELINDSYKISSWLIREMKRELGLINPNQQDCLLIEKVKFESITKKLRNSKSKIYEVHEFINFNEEDFYESYKVQVEKIKNKYPNASYNEWPEFIKEFVYKDKDLASKVYIWNDLNFLRFKLSFDFDFAKEYSTINSVFWSWEIGSQALLQRINEYYIQGEDSNKNIQVSNFFKNIICSNLSNLGIPFKPTLSLPSESISKAIEQMAEINSTTIILK